MLLRERWFWKLIIICMIILIVPMAVAWIIISMPPIMMYASIGFVLVLWCAVRGYRDWLSKKRGKSEDMREE